MTKGILLLLTAAFSFSLSTVFLKFAVEPPYAIPVPVASFARFLTAFIIFSALIAARGESLRPKNSGLILLRAVSNTAAVLLFYLGLKYTTVTKANILNLTYPAFIFIIAPYINRERPGMMDFVYLALTLAGAWFIVTSGAGPRLGGVNAGDLIALASGVVSAFAISILRETASGGDSPQLILFYQMAFGTVAGALAMLPVFVLPHGKGALHLLAMALLAALGQFCITTGYRYIPASLGGIVLSSGVLFAAVLGVSIFHDPFTLSLALGGLLILVSLAGVSVKGERRSQ